MEESVGEWPAKRFPFQNRSRGNKTVWNGRADGLQIYFIIDKRSIIVYNIGNVAGRDVRSRPRRAGPYRGRTMRLPQQERCIRKAAETMAERQMKPIPGLHSRQNAPPARGTRSACTVSSLCVKQSQWSGRTGVLGTSSGIGQCFSAHPGAPNKANRLPRGVVAWAPGPMSRCPAKPGAPNKANWPGPGGAGEHSGEVGARLAYPAAPNKPNVGSESATAGGQGLADARIFHSGAPNKANYRCSWLENSVRLGNRGHFKRRAVKHAGGAPQKRRARRAKQSQLGWAKRRFWALRRGRPVVRPPPCVKQTQLGCQSATPGI